MKDFFINLETPTLNSNYANSLNELVVNINQNFAKIASLPFLKGDSGVSIEVCDEVFYSEDDEAFTPFACAVINAIYGGDIPEDEYKIDGHNSYEDLKNIKTVPVFYDKSQGKKYLTVPFMFHDARKNYLGEVINTEHSMNFMDMSTFVLGSGIYNGTEWVWDMSKHDFEPKLYFNSNTQKFCWAIGSQKTEVIAQGVEGKPGASVYAKYCKGEFEGTDRTYIYITAILNEGSLVENAQPEFSGSIDEYLNDGDFVMVELTSPHTDLAFGKVMTVGDKKCIPYFANTTLYGAASHITLKELLNRVGKNIANDVDGVRGLYVYEKNSQTAENDGTTRTPHMFWVENNEGHLGMLKSDTQTTTETTKDTPELGDNGVLKIDYETTKAKVMDADLYTHTGDDPKILSYGNGETNKLELQQSAVDSGVKDGVLCFVPNPKVTYTEPAMTALTNVGSLDDDEEQEQTESNTNNSLAGITNTTIKNKELQKEVESSLEINTYIPTSTTTSGGATQTKKMLKLGGTFEFELPNLCVKSNKTSGETILYNTKQFVNAFTQNATPISVSLQQIELNNNQDLNDNTSFGWRYYLDNLLFASPIEKYVYAGTTNEVLSTKIGDITYKANVVISVIQYRIGYNSRNELAFKQGTWLHDRDINVYDTYINGKPTPTCPASMLEENYADWYKQDLNSGTYEKYISKNDKYGIGDYKNDENITLFVESTLPKATIPSSTYFDLEKIDENTPIKYKKLKWEEREFNHKTTVTDVIYYIVPMEKIDAAKGEIDVFSKISGKSESDTMVCMKYRMFFKSKKEDNENANTVFYNALSEPVSTNSGTSSAGNELCFPLTKSEGTTIKKLYNNSGDGIANICFICVDTDDTTKPLMIDLDTKTVYETEFDKKTPINNDKTALHPTQQEVTAQLGIYNDFKWCAGAIDKDDPTAVFAPNSNNRIVSYCVVDNKRCAPGCGRMLPQTPTQIQNTQWTLPLTETCTVDSSKQYEFYTQKSNDKKVNTLSTNILNEDFQPIQIGTSISLHYVLEKDNGWYINDRRIVTEAVNTDGKIYDKYADAEYPLQGTTTPTRPPMFEPDSDTTDNP